MNLYSFVHFHHQILVAQKRCSYCEKFDSEKSQLSFFIGGMCVRSLLFIYSEMVVGGSTTSLLSILNNLDPYKYSVDLYLFWDGGAMDAYIPSYVNVIVGARQGLERLMFNIRKRISPEYVVKYITSAIKAKSSKNELVMGQILGGVYPRFLPRINRQYDIAISFLEFGPCVYLSRYVNSSNKIAWLHLNYHEAKLLPIYENRWFSKVNHIVLVSGSCLEGFKNLYPNQANKALVIKNILSMKMLEARAGEPIIENDMQLIEADKNMKRLMSLSRIVFSHKGQDRVVRAMRRLLDENIRPSFVWYVIGDGTDMPQLKLLVHETGVEAYVRLLGMKDNPYPYFKYMDALLSSSYYEGKPMTVTEAHIFGLPVFTTRYSSADEQIISEFDGIIVENSEDGLFSLLKNISVHPELVSKLSQNVKSKCYDNLDEMQRVYELLEEKGEQEF